MSKGQKRTGRNPGSVQAYRGGNARTGRLSQAGGASETVSERERDFRQPQVSAYYEAYQQWRQENDPAYWDERQAEIDAAEKQLHVVDIQKIEERVYTQLASGLDDVEQYFKSKEATPVAEPLLDVPLKFVGIEVVEEKKEMRLVPSMEIDAEGDVSLYFTNAEGERLPILYVRARTGLLHRYYITADEAKKFGIPTKDNHIRDSRSL